MSKPDKIKIIHAESREVTEGKIYDVIEWDNQHNPKVDGNLGRVIVCRSKWVPAETDPEFKWGEKVLVRDTKDSEWRFRTFVALNPCCSEYKYLAIKDDDPLCVYAYRYCKTSSFEKLTFEEIQQAYKDGQIIYKPKTTNE